MSRLYLNNEDYENHKEYEANKKKQIVLYDSNNNQLNVEDIVLNTTLKEMQTGDIILFSGRHSIISSIIKWWTNSYYSHIGIVLVNPKIYDDNIFKELKGIYLLESGYENIDDADEHIRKFGVQIVPLNKVIKKYNGTVFWRKLNTERCKLSSSEINHRISQIYKNIRHKPYDLNLVDLLCSSLKIFMPITIYRYAFLNWFAVDKQKQDRFVCSALVAYIYTMMDFLPSFTNWTECIPKFFSNENPNLQLSRGVYLEPEKKIK